MTLKCLTAYQKFLSTLSLRRATAPQQENGQAATISIHALLAESDRFGCLKQRRIDISIHALLAESDLIFMLYDTSALTFLSTLSLRRATKITITVDDGTLISIHALLAESDIFAFWTAPSRQLFLSTLSLRRATRYFN